MRVLLLSPVEIDRYPIGVLMRFAKSYLGVVQRFRFSFFSRSSFHSAKYFNGTTYNSRRGIPKIVLTENPRVINRIDHGHPFTVLSVKREKLTPLDSYGDASTNKIAVDGNICWVHRIIIQ